MDHAGYIHKLLYDHDCVIIPGFGGFIGNYSPARIDSLRNEFFPPFKSLLFNPNLKQNDGLLAVAIAKGENLRFEEAMVSIKSMVGRWTRELGAGLSVEIEGVGRIYRDHEGNVQFDQTRENNFLSDTYGLTSIISPVISRREIIPEEPLPVHSHQEAREENPYFVPKVLKWAAFLALPLGTAALFGLSQVEKFRDLSVAYSGILFSTPAGETAKPASSPRATKVLPDKVIVKPLTLPGKTKEEPAVQTPATNEKPYMIIVGAFRFLENAESLVASLTAKGYEASMAGQTKTGLFRVSLYSSSDRNEAIRKLEMVRSGEFASAWLLVK